jgi:hypothetical protein
MRKALTFAIAIFGMGTLLGSAAVLGVRTPANPDIKEAVWTEANWPFPIDQGGTGKAFVCMPADCGARIDVYIRPKIGYCNCATGVADDAELERVADTDLVSSKPRARANGRRIKVGWMDGLSRPYLAVDGKGGPGLLSVAFNDECDVVVALAKVSQGDPAAFEPVVMNFLKSTPMVLWAKKELGLEFVRRDW